jgi:hypothetical protein
LSVPTSRARGEDWLFYDAPLVLHFYGSAYSDPADCAIAASLAMLAGESLRLGCCMLGFPGYIFRYSKPLREKYALPSKIQPGLTVVFGYPRFTRVTR